MSLREIRRGLLVLLLDGLILLLLSEILPGFVLDGPRAALGAAILIGALNALVWPALARFALPLTVLTLGIAALLLNALLVTLAIDVLPGGEIAGLFEGVVVTITMAAFTAIVYSLLSIDEDDA
jgi:putative membrane protein